MGILKRVSVVIVAILSTFVFINDVDAATASISVSSSKKQVLVGNEFNVTVKISSSENLGAWDYTLKYDSSQVKLVSGNQREIEDAGKSGVKSYSYTYKFKALKSCTSSISVKSYSVIDWASGAEMGISSAGSTSVKIMTQAELEATYSTNNYLNSLSITGYELSPAFSKDVSEYTVQLPPEAESIEVIAAVADKNASLTGNGVVAVTEGDNSISVVVTSQKGTTRTYTIIATVVDQNPIVVKINNEDYTVVKRATILTCPSTYVATTTKINDIDIPSFHSEITNYTLIGLKNSKNEVGLYVYNEKENSYTLYKEMNFAKVVFYPMSINEEIKNYKEYQIKINEELVNVYKTSNESKFALMYGTNVETGETGYYIYDSEENTLQRYNEDELNIYKKDAKDFMILSIVFGACLLMTVTVFICYIKKNNKIKEKIFGKKEKGKNKKEKEEVKVELDVPTDEVISEESTKKEKKNKKIKVEKKEIDEDFKI